MRHFLLTTLATALLLTAAAPAPNPIIVPGRAIGNVPVGVSPDSLPDLGKASITDGAMQKVWATWYSKPNQPGAPPHQLDIYTAAQGTSMRRRVLLVRATSPWFHTVGGMHVGSTMAQLQKECGPFMLAATYTISAPAGPRYLYDNARAGIAFELDGQAAASRCTAVLVHRPQEPDMAGRYQMMGIYLKEIEKRPHESR